MKNFKNIAILVSLDEKHVKELSELKDSELLSHADNIYFVHIFSERSKKDLPLSVDSHDFEDVKHFVMDRLKELCTELVPSHHNENDERHCHCLFNSSEKIKVLDYLEEVKADLVITSTKGEQGLEGVFKESFSFWLVEHAPCDVLVVRPKKA